MLREVINSEIYSPSILICPGRLEIHFALSNLDFDVRIHTQGHCARGVLPYKSDGGAHRKISRAPL